MLLDQIKNIPSTRRDVRRFGLSVGPVFVLLGLILIYYNRGSAYWILGVGVIISVFGLALPVLLKPLQKAWMTLAVILGWVMTRVILTVLFYLVFMPIGLIGRLFGKQFLDQTTDRSATSYWRVRDPSEYDRTSCERQF